MSTGTKLLEWFLLAGVLLLVGAISVAWLLSPLTPFDTGSVAAISRLAPGSNGTVLAHYPAASHYVTGATHRRWRLLRYVKKGLALLAAILDR